MKKIVVDAKKCIGCGVCPILAPKTFRMNRKGKSEVISQTASSQKEIKEAIAGCPVGAIYLKG